MPWPKNGERPYPGAPKTVILGSGLWPGYRKVQHILDTYTD